ncbi:MAG TPA: glycosyltransferase family 2 protein [Vicinamibacterales bacterium]|nr:glycosyltransferase family 2 protein [Vicinamibacterales bacterium]
MPKVSVTIITKNEAADIGAALDSVSWADERIVVDSCSTDETVAIAARHGARVVSREWPGYVAQKNHAASLAVNDWILSLDADERVTPALADEIRSTLEHQPAARGFRIPRVTFHLGRWIRTTDWYPDYQLRLYDRREAKWTGKYVHEGVTVNGRVGRLRNELQHYAYRDAAEHQETIDHYTTLAARQMFEHGRRASSLDLALQPAFAFFRNYILKRGFLDGPVGLTISRMNAQYVGMKFRKLRDLERER